MDNLSGNVVSVFVGVGGTLSKCGEPRLEFAFDGVVGDRHRGVTRKTWELTDKQPGGTERRNERQWSAVAQEDLDQVSKELGLNTPLSAGDVAVNLSISGVADFSRLRRGTTLVFEGGVVLMVEEYNPPCARMSKHLSETLTTVSGNPLAADAFIAASKFSRGLVGVVEVAGFVSPGERVTVHLERLPKWLRD